MISEAYAILKRNFNIIINSKLSSIAIFLGPILLMVVVGVVLQNTELRAINVGIYSANWQEMRTDNFVQGFEGKIGQYTEENSLEACQSKVVNAEYNACIEIKKGQYNPLENLGAANSADLGVASYQVTSYVDFSKTQIVWGVINRIQRVTDAQSLEMASTGILDAVSKIDNLINQIKTQRDNLNEIGQGLSNMESSIQNIENNANSVKSELSLARSDIKAMQNKLSSLKTFAGITIDMTNYINEIKFDLTNLDSKIAIAQSSTSSPSSIFSETTSLKGRITDMKNQVTSVISSMDEVISEWDNLKGIDLTKVSRPITSDYKSVLDSSESYGGQSLQTIDYLFPSFLMFFIIFVSLVFPATFIIRERTSKAYIRNATSKVKGRTFLIFNSLSCIIIISVQILVILFISELFLNVSILNNIRPIITIVLLAIGSLSLLGVAVGYLFNNHENSIIGAIILSLMFLIFLPGITPTEMLPSPFSSLLKLLPSTIFESRLSMSILAGSGLSFSIGEIVSIILTTLASIILITVLHNKKRRKEI